MNLTISETSIRQDSQGRFCLNDLHRAMNETLRLRTALARLGKDELRKVADLAKVPLRSLQRFADGELDDLPHTQFIDVRSAYRKTQVFA